MRPTVVRVVALACAGLGMGRAGLVGPWLVPAVAHAADDGEVQAAPDDEAAADVPAEDAKDEAAIEEADDEAAAATPDAPGDATAPTVVLESLILTDHVPSEVELSFSGAPPSPTAEALEAQDGKPERVIIDFPATTLGSSVPSASPGRGRLLQVRAGQYKPDVARIVLELSEPWPTQVRVKKDKIVIQLQEETEAGIKIEAIPSTP